MMLRAAIVCIAALGLFWFPWPLTLILICIAGILVPIAGLVLGFAVDLIYHPFVMGVFPYGTVLGIVICALGVFLQRFFESRIMGS